MAEIPPEMMALERVADNEFENQERLYRRVPPESFDGDEPSVAAVELPDMSVGRGKYGRPEWLLLHEDHRGWGVIYFVVRDIPPDREIIQAGIIAFTLEPRHVPLAKNYPHSEVWVFREGVHICKKDMNLHLLDPDFHLRWRERIVLASHVAIPPQSK
ncbi:MAG: hypothetical protein L0Y58_25400 [Verrucomicrobia subdivision 3 bacterium]|nr:hypothetical protein [Gemmataceae bacterium]MCI0748758.1 hypothetical protein [Limisphaerales bacterium]